MGLKGLPISLFFLFFFERCSFLMTKKGWAAEIDTSNNKKWPPRNSTVALMGPRASFMLFTGLNGKKGLILQKYPSPGINGTLGPIWAKINLVVSFPSNFPPLQVRSVNKFYSQRPQNLWSQLSHLCYPQYLMGLNAVLNAFLSN